MPQSNQNFGMTRRHFLKAAGLSPLTPAVVPTRSLAPIPPSDMMLLGIIGTGRQGINDMQELIYRGLEIGAPRPLQRRSRPSPAELQPAGMASNRTVLPGHDHRP